MRDKYGICKECCSCEINTANTVACTDGWSQFENTWFTSGALKLRRFGSPIRGNVNDPWVISGRAFSLVGSDLIFPQSIRLIGGMADCENYLFGEIVHLSADDNYIRIGTRQSGVDSYQAFHPFVGTGGPGLWNTPGYTKDLSLTWDGEVIIFHIGSVRVATRNVSPLGRYVGFGTGTANAHPLHFAPIQDWDARALTSALVPDCGDPILQCADGNVPPSIQVEIPACAAVIDPPFGPPHPCLVAHTYTFSLGLGGGDGGDSGGLCRWGQFGIPDDNFNVVASLNIDPFGTRMLDVIAGDPFAVADYLVAFRLVNPPMPPLTAWGNWIEVPFLHATQPECLPCTAVARVRLG